MMGFIANLFTKNTLIYTALLILAGLLLFITYQSKKIDSLETKNIQLKIYTDTLAGQIKQCNDATELLKQKTNELIAQKEAAQKQAQEIIRRGQKESKDTLDSPVPTDCKLAVAWGIDQLPPIVKSWAIY